MTQRQWRDAEQLEAAILTAHAKGDGFALAWLYEQAAQLKREVGDGDAAGFLLTHAYVFALESGHPRAQEMHKILCAEGREV